MGSIYRDLRYGFRMLAAKPGFTVAAVLVLALGIGANCAMFSLLNAFLLKPLHVANARELVGCYSRDTQKPDSYRAFSYANYAALRDKNTVFTSVMAHNPVMVGVAEGDRTRRVFADVVSSNYFATLGEPLAQGRSFTAQEEHPGSQIPVVIASYPFWQKSGNPELLGSMLKINGRQFTVVGIAAQGFTGTTALLSPALYLPLGVYEWAANDFDNKTAPLADPTNYCLVVVGRLKAGITQSAADAQLGVLAASLEKKWTYIVRPLARLSITTSPSNDNSTEAAAVLMLCMSGVVLLIASLNVANMMLARGSARRKEIAIRLALGSGRRAIVRQLSSEAMMLALAGAAGGLALANWGTTLLVESLAHLAPLDIVYSGAADVRVLAAAIGFCVLSTLIFGLGPAWSLTKPGVATDLKAGEYDVPAPGYGRLFSKRNLLVMGQLALSIVLLTAAGLFIRSSFHAARLEPGFRIDRHLVVELDPSLAAYDPAHGRQIYRDLLARLEGIPGVKSAAIAATVPFGMVQLGRGIQKSAGDTNAVGCRYNIVSPAYFSTLEIPVLRGRAFRDGDQAVVILDKLAAERLWPGGDPVGKHILLNPAGGTGPAQDVEVAGVVGSVRGSIFGSQAEAHVYAPFGQDYQADMHIHLALAGAGRELESRVMESVRRAIREYNDRLPLLTLRSMRAHLEGSSDFWAARMGSRMFSLFGGIALLVAMIGLYGVRAYTVARRTREIGIRVAVGATSGDVLRLILREGLVVTAIAAGVGLVLSLGVGRLLAGALYQVSAFDPMVLIGAPILLAAVSLAACYVPARNAARVDPMAALRSE